MRRRNYYYFGLESAPDICKQRLRVGQMNLVNVGEVMVQVDGQEVNHEEVR